MKISKNNSRHRSLATTACVLAVGAVSGYQLGRSQAADAATQELTYTGTLTDADGKALPGRRKIEVSLWDRQTDGSQVCSSGENDVPLSNGSFSISLPGDCVSAVHKHTELYIEVRVDSTALGRSKLGVVPYAVEAHTARNAAGALAESIAKLSTPPLGSSAQTAASSCRSLKEAGVVASGTYWVTIPASADASRANMPELVYCDQDTNDGGWALVSNSLLAPNTLQFWNIPYALRTTRRGRPAIEANFYDGGLYQTSAATYMDVIEDLRGRVVVALVATSSGINNTTMRFNDAVRVDGSEKIFQHQFSTGWSAPDYDGDVDASRNCAAHFNGVTQHYGNCWSTNLGTSAEGSPTVGFSDNDLGPHIETAGAATPLGLSNDGTPYTRVHRISRFVKW